MKQSVLLIRTGLGPAIGGTLFFVAAHYLPPTPYWDGFFRVLPAGILLLAIRRGLPRGSWWWKSLVLGTLNMGLFTVLLLISAQRLPGGIAATLNAMSSLVAIAVASVILKEKIRPHHYIACLIGVVGVALLVLRSSAALDAIGVLAGIGSASSMGVGTVLARKWGRPEGVHSLTTAGWTLLGAAVFLLPLAFLFEGPPPSFTGEQLLGLTWAAFVVGALGFALYLSGVQRLPVSLTAPLTLMNPVTAALLGWVAIGERFTPLQTLGAVLVCGAIVLVANPNILGRFFTKPEPEPDPKPALTAAIATDDAKRIGSPS
ncbi:DMT family transporter [Streptomyces sp. ISL-94]|uniref:DMT family transporter n=1 Tax=Streptomyces sp. ISL-94 TaxID=2819190 RepID=UPI001BED2DAC|nr:DMT family transporter [Streptomyces sp. ISL-94]MBT2481751.1 EamA family transporter [Streptomyces sp. ISL-94]